VFKKSPQGEMIVTKKPHMSEAITATQVALLDPKVRAKYERLAKKQNRRAWNLALSDCLQDKDLRARR
jgi:hypothetical protein